MRFIMIILAEVDHDHYDHYYDLHCHIIVVILADDRDHLRQR